MNTLPYTKRAKYPHMGKDDAKVWERFIDRFPKQFDSVAYDVRVGAGTPPPPDRPANYRKMQLDLSRKRIDVVALSPRSTTIIEVKEYAALSAIGQVLVYGYLYKRDSRTRQRIKLMIVCQQYDPDIIPYCNDHNIQIVTV